VLTDPVSRIGDPALGKAARCSTATLIAGEFSC
jgi:hypothetical protein